MGKHTSIWKVGDRVRVSDRYFDWVKETLSAKDYDEARQRFMGREGTVTKQYGIISQVDFANPADEALFGDDELEGSKCR